MIRAKAAESAPPIAEGYGRSRRLTALWLMAALAGCGGGSGGGEEAGGEAAQTVTVGADQPAIEGSTLSVPAAAGVDASAITIVAQPAGSRAETPQAAVEAEPAIHMAVVGYALDHIDEGLMHPLYGPVLALGRAEFAGPGIVLQPDGLGFGAPVTLSVPLAALGVSDPAGGLPLLRSADGSWQVPDEFSVDPVAGVATVELVHFSLLQWLRNAFVVPQQTAAIYTTGAVEAALARLRQDNLQRFAGATICSGQSPASDLDAIPPLPELLDYLGFEGRALRSGQEAALKDWITVRYTQARAGQRPLNSISLESLFERSLQLTGGDVFQALVTAHNALRDNRDLASVQDMIENYRGDGGDERGARYHFFGMALYAFAYEHYQHKAEALGFGGAQLVIGATMKPETVATIEEGIVSGDLVSDIAEYAVDLQGAKLGRELFARIDGVDRDRLAASFGFDAGRCDEIRFAAGFSGLNFDGSAAFAPEDADIRLSGDAEEPQISWNGPPAIGVSVSDLTGVAQPGDLPAQLFCIQAREDVLSGEDVPFAPPVRYGGASGSGFEACASQPAASPPLQGGRRYQVVVGSGQISATIIFTLQ